MTYLLITVRWLDDRYHGLLGREGPPEWPPSPFRLFQAIVSGVARRGELDSALGESLAWLQTLAPPTIIAPRSCPGQVITRFVPNNDGDKKPDRQHRLKGKTSHPTLILDRPEIHYVWQIHDNELKARLVCKAARHLTCLGWGIDTAYAEGRLIGTDEIAGLSGDHWRPMRGITQQSNMLRVPISGPEADENSLNDLKRAHQSALNRIEQGKPLKTVDKPKVFDRVFYESRERQLSRPFVAFKLIRGNANGMADFSATRAVTVAGMIRHATAEAARRSGWDEAAVVQYILGHRDNPEDALPRFAYVSLPTIEPPPRDVAGGIRRVLIAEPLDSRGEHIAWLNQFMPGQVITDDEGSEVAVLERIENDGVVRRYVDRATTWISVTPVALPGSDEGKANKTDKLLEKMFRYGGYSLDSVAELDFHRVPFLRGAEDAKRYRPKEPHYLANCTMYHMRIRWKHPMGGPIVLGAGRFCGLGVFAALGDD